MSDIATACSPGSIPGSIKDGYKRGRLGVAIEALLEAGHGRTAELVQRRAKEYDEWPPETLESQVGLVVDSGAALSRSGKDNGVDSLNDWRVAHKDHAAWGIDFSDLVSEVR